VQNRLLGTINPHNNTPQQDGVVEHMNKTLLERARCMLNNVKLQQELWAKATLIAYYLVN